jgi:predicted amidohydrolase
VAFGIIICADSSSIEPALIAAMRGAQVIFSPHFNYIPYPNVHDHTRRVRASHVARAMETEAFVCKANVVVPESQGVQVFTAFGPGVGVGDSFVVSPWGEFVAEAGLFTETTLVYDIPRDRLAGPKRRFHRVSPAMVEQLYVEYRRIVGG